MEGYKNEWFVRNLVNASEKETLAEAAPEWKFSHFGRMGGGENKKYGNCQLCHARFVKYVAIKNKRNSVVLLIGEDCYDKLLEYLVTEKLEGINLKSRKKYIAEIKEYCKKEINEAFLEWFKGVENLPPEIQETLAVIEALGYAPSLSAAQEIVQYYKENRLFAIEDLLTYNERNELRVFFDEFPEFQQELPEEATILGLEKIRELKSNLEKILKQRRQRIARKIKNGEFLQLENATVYNDNSGHGKPPEMGLDFLCGKVWLNAPLSRTDIKDHLGIDRFTKEVLELLRSSIPKQARFDFIDFQIYREHPFLVKMKTEDLLDWLQAPKIAEELKRRKERGIKRKEREGRRNREEQEMKQMAYEEMDKAIAEGAHEFMKIPFYQGINKKTGKQEWAYRDPKTWVKYVLHWRCRYDPDYEDRVYVKVHKKLASKLVIVERIYFMAIGMKSSGEFYWYSSISGISGDWHLYPGWSQKEK